MNPTAELRDFRFISGLVHGTICNSRLDSYVNGMTVTIEAYKLHTYRDHYFIVRGTMVDAHYIIAYKKYERFIL